MHPHNVGRMPFRLLWVTLYIVRVRRMNPRLNPQEISQNLLESMNTDIPIIELSV